MGTRRRSFISAAFSASLAGAAHLAAPAARLSRARAQLAGEASLLSGRLAYLLGGHLWLVASDGSERRLATGTGGWLQDPCWSPDGAQVAYSHVRFPIPTPGSTAIPWPSAEIYTARADSFGEPAVLVRRETPNDTLVSPAWSPDNRALFVIRRRPLDDAGLSVAVDLLRIDLATGERRPILVPGEPVELATGDDGSLAVVTFDSGATGASTSRLLRLAPDDPAGIAAEIVNSDQGLGFVAFPRFSPGTTRLLFAAGGGDTAARQPGLFDTFLGRTAEAHGARGWPHVLDLATNTRHRVPTDGLDDLVGLAWLDAGRVLVFDAGGFGIANLEHGAIQRVPGLTATGFAWFPGG